MKLNTLKEILDVLHDDNGMCYKDVNVNMTSQLPPPNAFGV